MNNDYQEFLKLRKKALFLADVSMVISVIAVILGAVTLVQLLLK